MQPQVVTVVPHFDPNSNRYRCWCGGCCRITTCAKIIGTLELIAVVINFIAPIAQYAQWPDATRRTELIVGIITFLVAITVIALLFYGIIKQKAAYLIPHLVMQIIVLLPLAVGVILTGLAASAVASGAVTGNDDKYGGGSGAVAVYVVLLIALLIAFCLEILFFVNILRCYRFLKDKAIAERMAAAVPPQVHPAMASHEQQASGQAAGFQNDVYDGDGQYKGGPA